MFNPSKRPLETEKTEKPPPPKRRKIDGSLPPPPFGENHVVIEEEEDKVEIVDKKPFPERMSQLIKDLHSNIKKNTFCRSKYPDDPSKFIDSDINLEACVRKFSELSLHPQCYPEFVKQKGVRLIVPLLSHENLEIVFILVDLLVEWTDAETPTEHEECLVLPDSIISENDTLPLLVGLLQSKVSGWEKDLDRGKLVYNILTVIDQSSELIPESHEILLNKTGFFDFLFTSTLEASKIMKKINKKNNQEEEREITFFKPLFHYFCEVLFGTINRLEENDKKRLVVETDIVPSLFPKLMQTMMLFDGEKEIIGDLRESFENISNTLNTLLLLDSNKQEFLKVAGMDFFLGFLRNNGFSRKKFMRLLSVILMNSNSACNAFIEKRGIKLIFGLFMKFLKKKKKKKNKIGKKKEVEEHIISCLVSLVQNFHLNSQNELIIMRIRKKFVEKEFEKTLMILELFEKNKLLLNQFNQQVQSGEFQNRISSEEFIQMDSEEMEDRVFLGALENGGLILQLISILICFICKDQNVKKIIFNNNNDDDNNNQKIRKNMIQKFVDGYAESVNDIDQLKWCGDLKKNIEN